MAKYAVYRTNTSIKDREVAARHLANLREEMRQRLNTNDWALIERETNKAMRSALEGTPHKENSNG